MARCELEFQKAIQSVNNAQNALQDAYKALESIEMVQNGTMKLMLANRAAFACQSLVIKDKNSWLEYAKKELEIVKIKLKESSLEYEKFKYLELEEVKKILKEQKIAEAKEMDEVAILSYDKRENL